MKRFLSVLLIPLTLVLSLTVLASAERYVTVILDGETLEFDVQAEIINGRTMVPLRKIFESMGAEVDWDDTTRTAIATKGTRTVEAQINNNQMRINSVIKSLDTPPMLKGGRTLVPVRFVAEAYGVLVEWEDATSTVTLTSPEKQSITGIWNEPYNYDLTPYITVKPEDYIGIHYPDYKVEISDESVAESLMTLLSQKAELVATEEACAVGNTVTVDFKGKLDGVYFDGGSAQNVEILLGQGQFIPGFEEGIIGHRAGESFEINVTFPENYGNDLSGKAVVFEIVLHSVKKTVFPELDDSFIAENTEYSTINEYLMAEKQRLESISKIENINTAKNEIYTLITSRVKINGYPKAEYDAYYNEFYAQYESLAKSYGMELETFIPAYTQVSLEEFDAYAVDYARSKVSMELIFMSIARAEKLIENITVADYIEFIDLLSAQNSMNHEDFEEMYGKNAVMMSLIVEKTMDYIYLKGVPVEK